MRPHLVRLVFKAINTDKRVIIDNISSAKSDEAHRCCICTDLISSSEEKVVENVGIKEDIKAVLATVSHATVS